MSTSFQSEPNGSETRDELLVHEHTAEHDDDRARVGSSVRDMAARIPEQL